MERFAKPLTALILVIGAIVLAFMFAEMWYVRLNSEPKFENPDVLRVYAVPTERAQDIRSALSATLDNSAGKSPPLGRVMLSGTNQLLVLAPLMTQESISNAIAKLGGATKDAAAGAPSGVRLSVWIVDSAPGAGSDDAALAPLADALKAARGAIGETHFRLYDALSVSTIPNGGDAQVASGRGTRVGAHLRPTSNGVQVELNVAGEGPGRIETTTLLPFGQFVVLAQIAAPAADGAPGAPRLYVVRAESAGG